jgi:DDE superfamily endonuclease
MQIRLEDRFEGDAFQRAVMVVDGIDFQIAEPLKNGFSSVWYSQKWNGPGIKYEIATCIKTGKIVWINGPFPCARFNDLQLYRIGLKGQLTTGERVWGDLGYKGEYTIITPERAISQNHLRDINRARSRHEAINGRLTQFGSLHQFWRHDLNKHYLVLYSAAVIHNIECELWGPTFTCDSQHDSAFVN